MEKVINNSYTAVIGLEVHAQLLTKSKIYTSDSTQFGDSPNTNVSVITLGHPGALPRLNKKVVEYAIKMGLACGSDISRSMIFDRKNYFYPDLPKGYQITQDRTPICVGGEVLVTLKNGEEKRITLNRIHIEEDAGKSIHLQEEIDTLIDFNRAGVPLIEIVTEPVIRSAEEAGAFLTEVRRIVRYLDICDGNMEEGSLRCDANISVMPRGANVYGKKVEVKNMNSIRNVQRAIQYEIERQITMLEHRKSIHSETRTFDADTGATSGMRTKEELNDYRYFPDPDLSPVSVSEEWLTSIQESMPDLPWVLCNKFIKEFSLPEYDARFLTDTKEMAGYFEAACQSTSHYKAVSNWVMGPIKSYLNEHSIQIQDFPLRPEKIVKLVELVENGKVSFTAASQHLLKELVKNPDQDPAILAAELNIIQEQDSATLEKIIDEVIQANPEKVAEFKRGKKGLIGMFMGEIMKKSKGKADPKLANELIKERLN